MHTYIYTWIFLPYREHGAKGDVFSAPAWPKGLLQTTLSPSVGPDSGHCDSVMASLFELQKPRVGFSFFGGRGGQHLDQTRATSSLPWGTFLSQKVSFCHFFTPCTNFPDLKQIPPPSRRHRLVISSHQMAENYTKETEKDAVALGLRQRRPSLRCFIKIFHT